MKGNKKILLTIGVAVLGVALAAGVTIGAVNSCDRTEKESKVKYSFNTMGGAAISEVTVDQGAEYVLPEPAAREGYAFEGWYTTETFEGEPITSVTAAGDQTYYAKWTQLAKITLDANGGTIAQTTLYAKAGVNLYDFMQEYVPEKSGLTFGSWFVGENELSTNAKVPEAGVTLTAKYKVSYTVQFYLQNEAGTEYVLSEESTVTGLEYVGANYVSSQVAPGFKENTTHPDRFTEMTLSANASENVFKHYFDRQTYTVTFVPNHPDGTTAEEVSVTEKYGVKVYVPYDYEAEGYCLIGWSEDPDATTAEYAAYYVDTVLHNVGNVEARESDWLTPTENLRLYGVWAKGYTDMFGGDDYLFFLEEDEEIVYLSRGNVFFKGEYDVYYNQFYFTDVSGDMTILSGKLYDNNMFAYISSTRNGYTAYLYSVGEGLVETTWIEFDDTNGVTFKKRGEADTKGTQQTNEDGEYVADFTAATQGYMAGKTLTFTIGTYDSKNAFIVLNEAERDLGTIRRLYYDVSQNTILSYTNGFGDITLNGYGVATYNNGNQISTYYYTYEDDVITLLSAYGGLFGKAIVTTFKGETGYVLYTEWQDMTFDVEGGGTLTLDGGFNATYTKDSVTLTGYYSTITSQFGGSIVKFTTSDDAKYTFIVKGTFDDDGLLTDYTVTTALNTYGEYRYLSEGTVYNAVMIVVDEVKAGYLTVYGFNTRTNEFVKVSDGAYVEGEEGYYQYTVENNYPCEGILTTPVDPSSVQSFVFALDSKTTSYNVFYWESSTDLEGEKTPYVVEYECATEANATLKLVGGFAYYTLDGVPVSGAYVEPDKTESYIAILTSNATGSKNYYVELDKENYKFIPLEYAPYTAYMYGENGKLLNEEDNSVSIFFDGKGKAVYTEKDGTPIDGKTVLTDEKTGDVFISVFTSNDGEYTFKYLGGLTLGNTSVFIRYNDAYNGRYELKVNGNTAGLLTLDGYGYIGQYRNAEGTTFEGRYLVVEENVIALTVTDSNEILYFDITEREFTIRSEEYGEYLWIENQDWIEKTFFELNGYGTLLVYTKSKSEEEEGTYVKEYICENGTYEQDGDVFTLKYTDANGTPVVLVGELGLYSGVKAFIVKFDEDNPAIGVYVNADDWSVLILDDIGNAIKYTNEGIKEEGHYTLITSDLLYYMNAAGTDACIYVYDTIARSATQVKFNTTRYLTEDMETLTFYEYGFLTLVNKDGTSERHYYYNDKENNKVVIYVSEPDNENATDYGFIEKEVTLIDQKYPEKLEFEGKEYFKNDGNILRFNRAEANKTAYPVDISGTGAYTFDLLTFDATSDVEFTVDGRVSYNGSMIDCTVTREIDEDGKEVTYVNVGTYRFYVDFTYAGLDELANTKSEYTITGMEYRQITYSSYFLDNYAYYAGFGYSVENTLGEIVIHGTYNEDGTEQTSYVDATFLENSSVKDMDGNLIVFENAEYVYNGEYYSATFEAQDGYTYTLHFIVSVHRSVRAYAYNVLALARHQSFTVGEYEVLTQRVLYSEYISYEKGDIFTVIVKKNGEDLEGSLVRNRSGLIQVVDGKLYYVVRTTEETFYTAATYYEIVLESEPVTDSVDGTVSVPFYKSVSITETLKISKIVYSENKAYFVDFTDSGVTMLSLANETLIVNDCKSEAIGEIPEEYLPQDDATVTAAYTVTTATNGRRFWVQVREKVVDGETVSYVWVQEIFN